MTLVSQEIITEDEAEILTRNICARIWRTYGEVYHGQEWIGLDNIPEDGALIVYYHGPVPVDYFGLVAEMWLRRNKTVHSVVDRSLMQIPYMENLRKQFNLFPGTVDSCAEVLKQDHHEGTNTSIHWNHISGQVNTSASPRVERLSHCLETATTRCCGVRGRGSQGWRSRPTSRSSPCLRRTSGRTRSHWPAG